jgi:hypothetical protein
MGKWLEEISVSQKRFQVDEPVRSTLPPAVTEGNLAALEDEPSVPMFPRTASTGRPVAPAGSSAALMPMAQSSSTSMAPQAAPSASSAPLIPDLPPRRSGAATRLGVTVAVVVMAAAGAAAWFTHLIPHP